MLGDQYEMNKKIGYMLIIVIAGFAAKMTIRAYAQNSSSMKDT